MLNEKYENIRKKTRTNQKARECERERRLIEHYMWRFIGFVVAVKCAIYLLLTANYTYTNTHTHTHIYIFVYLATRFLCYLYSRVVVVVVVAITSIPTSTSISTVATVAASGTRKVLICFSLCDLCLLVCYLVISGARSQE